MQTINTAPYIPLDSITSEAAAFRSGSSSSNNGSRSNNGSGNGSGDDAGRHKHPAPSLDGSPTPLMPDGGSGGGSSFDVLSESDGDGCRASSGGGKRKGPPKKKVSFWVRHCCTAAAFCFLADIHDNINCLPSCTSTS